MYDNYKGVEIRTWTHEFDGNDVLTIKADIMNTDYSTSDAPLSIGEVGLYIFDEFLEGGLFDAADSVSGESESLVSELIDKKDEDIEDFSRIGLIHRIFIKEEYRDKGIGTHVFKTVHQYLSRVMGAEVITLIACPIEMDHGNSLEVVNDEVKKKRLTKWYRSFGYQQLDAEENHLYIDARLLNPIIKDFNH
ncbi:GNAT family N-acetyltransferase [Halobacillus litoralis]|uniref:N-acetyltransferase domain-containing protein n=1 Tax=Halobacillus litoralis TaxID=45668 RepID=A0A410MJ67_9BACI|nr:GNAT family N-acetyltransferase [Halobacillus litoralis]QAS54769.1 hypothetical protein HLI_21160 [Halobacillus litoralis]